MVPQPVTDGVISGPQRVDRVQPDLIDALTALWGRVTAAGGAVGFAPDDPITDIRAAAELVVQHVRARQAYLLTLSRGPDLVGAAVLVPGRRPIRRHTGELQWLMVDPDLQRQGWGRRLLDAVHEQATALGLSTLVLHTRSGHGLEAFYTAAGWVERGRWPRAVRMGPDDHRDEIWLTRDL